MGVLDHYLDDVTALSGRGTCQSGRTGALTANDVDKLGEQSSVAGKKGGGGTFSCISSGIGRSQLTYLPAKAPNTKLKTNSTGSLAANPQIR